MNNIKDVIVNSLKYYDLNNEKYSKLFDKIKYFKLTSIVNDLEHSIIHFYDKNNQEFFSSRYEVLSVYIPKHNLWTWSWAIPFMDKNTIYLSKKMLLYGIDLDHKEALFLKSEMITSRFKITDDTQLDIYAAIASYITKIPMVLKLSYDQSTYKEGELFTFSYDHTEDSIVYYFFLLDENGITHDNINK
ncbi:hypothetical protein QKU48_gp0359 [Fadolivirus algeromassiliense]|jgi:hypothetical protein|uniref:Uncharacterized protein n=1 Tax=Fadolivirus FV1/VV64 TaxID=3070911 RepID=A0A7D3V8N7_9VIRU|nr:hypothetical protein QKU48_gp0359 [Fadolivirus algeromassiliense]QKF93817.1 hypothetical protein Fadolivirus_1_359 [Fadolivirus FV1/VV64]